MFAKLNRLDTFLLARTQGLYLDLLDRFGLLKGDALAALLIASVALGRISVPAIALKLICLTLCLNLSLRQRRRQLAYVNATADWLRRMAALRLLMAMISVVHVTRDPRPAVIGAQLIAFAAIYLWCAKVRERDDRGHRKKTVGIRQPAVAGIG
jgi:hypothetical protein